MSLKPTFTTTLRKKRLKFPTECVAFLKRVLPKFSRFLKGMSLHTKTNSLPLPASMSPPEEAERGKAEREYPSEAILALAPARVITRELSRPCVHAGSLPLVMRGKVKAGCKILRWTPCRK